MYYYASVLCLLLSLIASYDDFNENNVLESKYVSNSSVTTYGYTYENGQIVSSFGQDPDGFIYIDKMVWKDGNFGVKIVGLINYQK